MSNTKNPKALTLKWIDDNPGITSLEISRGSSMSIASVRHSIKVLLREQEITFEYRENGQNQGSRHYYSGGTIENIAKLKHGPWLKETPEFTHGVTF